MNFITKVWKKGNRGLWLGLLLLVSLILYSVGSAISLGIQKQEIAAKADDMTNHLFAVNELMEGTVGSDYTEEQKLAAKQEFMAMIDRDWAKHAEPSKDILSDIFYSYSSTYDKDQMVELFDKHLHEVCLGNYKNFKCEISRDGYSVSSNGPRYALCEYTVSVSYEANAYTGADPFPISVMDLYRGYTDTSEPPVSTKVTERFSVTYELHKENGEWKIASISISQDYSYSDSIY